MMSTMMRFGALRLPRAGALFAGGVGFLLAVTTAIPDSGAAQVPVGKKVEFLLQDSVKIDKGQMVIVTSGASGKKEVGNCGSGAFPVQNAMVMMPSGTGSSRRLIGGYIPLGDASVTGTRLVSITGGEPCGPGFRKFTGTTQ